MALTAGQSQVFNATIGGQQTPITVSYTGTDADGNIKGVINGKSFVIPASAMGRGGDTLEGIATSAYNRTFGAQTGQYLSDKSLIPSTPPQQLSTSPTAGGLSGIDYGASQQPNSAATDAPFGAYPVGYGAIGTLQQGERNGLTSGPVTTAQ